jgi:hypothetical protein
MFTSAKAAACDNKRHKKTPSGIDKKRNRRTKKLDDITVTSLLDYRFEFGDLNNTRLLIQRIETGFVSDDSEKH